MPEIQHPPKKLEINKIYCMDSLDLLNNLEYKQADLILTDPPYGINASSGLSSGGRRYEDTWDSETPSKEVFDKILDIGIKIIICGGNFFLDKLPFKKSWIVWDKIGNMNSSKVYSDV